MKREEIVARFERYVTDYQLPVRYETRVESVEPLPSDGYRVTAADGVWQARNVVVATGLYQRPKVPPFAAELAPDVDQLHSGVYRNPAALAPGAVLVVGSGQSGCQIAEELYQSGRHVYLCIGKGGRAPRRYRGRDVFEWLELTGFMDQTPDKLPSPRAKFVANPHVSGRDGGHNLNLHQFARDGVSLLGRLETGDGQTIRLAPDLHESLARVDQIEADILKMIDGYLERSGLDAPGEEVPQLRDGYHVEPVTELNLRAAGVTTIIWAFGHAFDFGLVKLPVVDGDGFPITNRGVSEFSGLFFAGMPWLYTRKTGVLGGVGDQAKIVAEAIAGGSG
jgi:putative flavoprotein involved in K+ transport